MTNKSESQHPAYIVLKPEALLTTLARLESRVVERFPGSGLSNVAKELRSSADDVVLLSEKLRKPFWTIRFYTIFAILLLVGTFVWMVVLSFKLIPVGTNPDLTEIVQSVESAINELIFLSLAILFLITIESRVKRKMALKSLHRLRSIAHVVDMHQLTKDPFYLLVEHKPTATSPDRTMTKFELARYLDYCSELLAVISKLAAIHVQYLQDPQVLETVNDVENLTHGLSAKIWQKLMILEK
ncbi:MAG: hypothetical protein IPO92_10280 [Saprospiraceae bacterium]|nr:hypothetical protein [Saprospiraceae bacterium]